MLNIIADLKIGKYNLLIKKSFYFFLFFSITYCFPCVDIFNFDCAIKYSFKFVLV